MNSPKPAVVVRDLVKRFGDFTAVDRVSLRIKEGEVYGFLGPNGAGKTTTIRMLCGILEPTAGAGSVAGRDIYTEREAIKSKIGYMSQKFSLYEDLTVEENIDFYAGIYRIPSSKKRDRKSWVLEMAGLEEHRRTLTAHLATGWKQRLGLGCAILHEPPILFLDEPTSGVDPESRRRFWDLIYRLSDTGVTIFVTTHYMDEAEYCGRIGLIYHGRLIASGTPASLKTDPASGHILEIRCDRPQDLISDIEAIEGVREAAFFGRGLHAVVDDPGKEAAAIQKVMERRPDASGPSAGVAAIVPSLEDVFVSLIEQNDRVENRAGRG